MMGFIDLYHRAFSDVEIGLFYIWNKRRVAQLLCGTAGCNEYKVKKICEINLYASSQ
jgi:hypothetical protein